jgi:hypothetical protein
MPVRHLAAGAAFREALTANRAPMMCAAAFVGTAAAVAAMHMATPITRGWWLVAYLTLGGVLVVALVLFAHSVRDVDVSAPGVRDRWIVGYALLLIALGCSVAIGVALAG